MSDSRNLVEFKKLGEQIVFHDLLDLPLWLSWCDIKRDESEKRFYVAATFAATGAYFAQRYRRR